MQRCCFVLAIASLLIGGLAQPRALGLDKKPRAPQTKELCGISWHPKLPDAFQAAKQQDRPVMVLRVLGAIDGFM
jgi:hypothetical protein